MSNDVICIKNVIHFSISILILEIRWKLVAFTTTNTIGKSEVLISIIGNIW